MLEDLNEDILSIRLAWLALVERPTKIRPLGRLVALYARKFILEFATKNLSTQKTNEFDTCKIMLIDTLPSFFAVNGAS